ncbi:MAG TPA: sigma-54 dependent transcriptional regulator, partial [Negativicutes bacterium]|nr:sigma-54 dependent transcriptional regulator [Negativicutes bacterium]
NNLVKNIEKYAKVDAPVLITGESGVGKEVVADLIHNFSDRKNAPFLKINCGAIPEPLLESELFGYEEGAFSGAKKGGKIGFFELAHNGTVLLDEIGDLPFSLQVKLLRCVQNGDFYRIGGNRSIKVNTRIIAATNRDLETMVLHKEFRSDLFYRLQVLTIHIPALRERPSDIIPLTQHFLKRFNEKYNTGKALSPEVYRIFTNYSWEGNVRELENLVERLVVTSESRVITADSLPEMMGKAVGTKGRDGLYGRGLTYKEAKEQFERQYFQQVIEEYGSTRKVAQKVMLDHSTIVKKAAKYGINLLHWQRS